MSDNTFWCTVVLGIIGLVVSTIVGLTAIDAYRDCRYIEAGYTRTTVPGHDWPIWVKGSPGDCNRAAPAPGLDPRNWVVSEPVPLSNAAGSGR